MKIIFHENQLCYRGTSIALYDYARFNEEILGNESLIVFNKNNKFNKCDVIDKFKKRFDVYGYSSHNEFNHIIGSQDVDLLYAIKSGKNDGIFSEDVRTVVHAVFKEYDPHGDIYAYVSEWLSIEMTGGKLPYVPHMVYLPDEKENLRFLLKIPKDALVFGSYGGEDSFDLDFVRDELIKIAQKNRKIYFIFMGIPSFVKRGLFKKNLENIIFIPASSDSLFKVRFINTCDAFIHARRRGESFGLAIAEFSTKNKPIITWGLSEERSHLNILGSKAIIYYDHSDLNNILINFKVNENESWDCYSSMYNPNTIMEKFKTVFIDSFY